MTLYLFGDGLGNWYQGCSPTGRAKYTTQMEAAVFFNEEDKEYAEDCLGLGLNLYTVEVSTPVLVKEGSMVKKEEEDTGTGEKFWEVYPMDLFSRE